MVEAQFAAHTKNLKSRRRDQDAQFLAERVIDPELLLRSSDDRAVAPEGPGHDDGDVDGRPAQFLFENRELAFLRNVRLLYQDYLDGSPLHRSDTKASVQLLGNLALSNLRRSHLGHLLREGRSLDRLDLSRSGGLSAGLSLVQLHHPDARPGDGPLDPGLQPPRDPAGPVGVLAGAGRAARSATGWPAGSRSTRMKSGCPSPRELSARHGRDGSRSDHRRSACDRTALPAAPGSRRFLETVEFTAVDFLADEADRDAEIRFGSAPQVAELARRRPPAERPPGFPELPAPRAAAWPRTINPYIFYENYLSPEGGSPSCPSSWPAVWAGQPGLAVRGIYRVVGEILHPQVDQDRKSSRPDTYWAALRKIHRMRKPVFMGSLWLRARFDVEYLGLALPTAPPGIAAESLMENDLDFIGATRQDRIIAEQVRREHHDRLEWITRWLHQFGWTFDKLPHYLFREIPFLANRGGETLRALVDRVCPRPRRHRHSGPLDRGAQAGHGLCRRSVQPAGASPPDSPSRSSTSAGLWHPVHRCRRPAAELFDLPCFPAFDAVQQATDPPLPPPSPTRRPRLGPGGPRPGRPDPWATVKARVRDACSGPTSGATRSWSSAPSRRLTMLDVQHNCTIVWDLGGYTSPDPGGNEPETRPLASILRSDEEPVSSLR